MVFSFICYSLLFYIAETYCKIVHSGQEDTYYPANDLIEAEHLYPLTSSSLPPSRVHHIVDYVEPYFIIFGGYSESGELLDDIHFYDTRQQLWSGPILRYVDGNQNNDIVEISGNQLLKPRFKASGHNDTHVDAVHQIPLFKTGFEGDFPSKRAEHTSAGLNGKLYIFGGYGGHGGRYGLMNDLYSYDVNNLQWVYEETATGITPPRRAGHSMVADGDKDDKNVLENLYIFGGRGYLDERRHENPTRALSDIWRFNVRTHHWTCLTRSDGTANDNEYTGYHRPVGRQYASMAFTLNRLFIFGGSDPSSGLLLNDMWSFHPSTQEWTLLQHTDSNRGSSGPQKHRYPTTPGYDFISASGRSPPPLNSAYMFAASSNMLILYGGVGGGGSCGNSSLCNKRLTTLGQVYSFTIATTSRAQAYTTTTTTTPYTKTNTITFHGSRVREVFDGEPIDNEGKGSADFLVVDACTWNYTRLSTGEGSPLDIDGTVAADAGQIRKSYGLEGAAFDIDTMTLYEFGGIEAILPNTATTATTTPSNNDGDNNVLRSAAQNARRFETTAYPLALDSGGEIGAMLGQQAGLIGQQASVLWDSESGEHLRPFIDTPANAAWEYNDAFRMTQPVEPEATNNIAKQLEFKRAFKRHTVYAATGDLTMALREDS